MRISKLLESYQVANVQLHVHFEAPKILLLVHYLQNFYQGLHTDILYVIVIASKSYII